MKCLGLEFDRNRKPVLLVENGGLFRKKVERYVGEQAAFDGLLVWSKLPDGILVHDALSFQLDRWYKVETDRLKINPRGAGDHGTLSGSSIT